LERLTAKPNTVYGVSASFPHIILRLTVQCSRPRSEFSDLREKREKRKRELPQGSEVIIILVNYFTS